MVESEFEYYFLWPYLMVFLSVMPPHISSHSIKVEVLEYKVSRTKVTKAKHIICFTLGIKFLPSLYSVNVDDWPFQEHESLTLSPSLYKESGAIVDPLGQYLWGYKSTQI